MVITNLSVKQNRKLDNAKKLEYLWRDENKILWIESFLKIVDKSGMLVPFILTDEQRDLVNNLGRENIVLKSRQLGISSVTIALSIRECIVKPNTTCLLVSHNQASTSAIFDKLKQQFESLPKWIKPKTLSNNRQEIKMVNGSKITCITCGNKDLGRGDTFNGIVHLSEFAFWKNPDRQLKSLTQALGNTGVIVIESTANGFNKFSDVYFDAKDGVSTYTKKFYNWINGGKLFEDQYKLANERFKNETNRDFCETDIFDEERYLLSLGATPMQILWRRQKINTDGDKAFKIEFPTTDTECFTTTGKSIFDLGKVDKLLTVVKKDNYIKSNKIIGLPNALKTYYGSSLKIWKVPQSGAKYWVGVDCSEGIGSDSHAIVVIDKNCEVCCTFKNNKIKPYQLSDILNVLGRYYNKGKLAIEKASGGHSVIERLRYDNRYLNMLKYKSYDEYNKMVFKIGFETNAKTKSILVNDLLEYFDKGILKINDREILNEMKVFVSNDNGKMGAIQGCHDDMVMALGIAVQCQKDSNYYSF